MARQGEAGHGKAWHGKDMYNTLDKYSSILDNYTP